MLHVPFIIERKNAKKRSHLLPHAKEDNGDDGDQKPPSGNATVPPPTKSKTALPNAPPVQPKGEPEERESKWTEAGWIFCSRMYHIYGRQLTWLHLFSRYSGGESGGGGNGDSDLQSSGNIRLQFKKPCKRDCATSGDAWWFLCIYFFVEPFSGMFLCRGPQVEMSGHNREVFPWLSCFFSFGL